MKIEIDSDDYLPSEKNNNTFVPSAPFLYPLKTSENLNVFWCFQGVEKRFIGN